MLEKSCKSVEILYLKNKRGKQKTRNRLKKNGF